ncbi:MAG: glycosyltransferase family 39 protein [Acidobacteriota bacterium]
MMDQHEPKSASPEPASESSRPGLTPAEEPTQRPRSGMLKAWAVPLVAVTLILGLGTPALLQYNVTWDEALGDLFYGQRYLSFFLTFDETYLDYRSRPYPEGHRPNLELSPNAGRTWEYYPFANTLAAATSRVLSGRLGLLDSFDGFHAFNLLLASLFALIFFPFLERRFGWVAATSALGFLFLMPRVVSHMMANIKDFPLMVLFSLTAMAFLTAYERGSAKGLLASGVLLGMSLATKANAWFFPAIPGLMLLLGGWPRAWLGRRRLLILTLIGAGLLGLAVMVVLWPYLWPDPIGRFGEHFRYIYFRKGLTRPESEAPAFLQLLLTTPPIILGIFAVGLVPCWRAIRRGSKAALMLPIWIAVVMGRYLLPQATNFDGVRHFLEVLPPIAAIAGLGVGWIFEGAARRLPAGRARPALAVAGTALVLLPPAAAVAGTHPFQVCYWNALTGGFAGARDAGRAQASDYWGMSYRLGIDWLNHNAPENSLVVVPVAGHAVRLVAPERLRPDLRPFELQGHFADFDLRQLRREGPTVQRRAVLVMFVERRDWMTGLMRHCLENLEPLEVWTLEGAPVLSIYHYADSVWQRSADGEGWELKLLPRIQGAPAGRVDDLGEGAEGSAVDRP